MLYKLNRRVKVVRWGNIKNEFGGNTAIQVASWYKWAEVRSSNWINLDLYNNRSGRINSEYQQDVWQYDTTIILRYESERPTRSNDTIEYNGYIYQINSITVNNEYSQNFEIIKCQKIDTAISSDGPIDTDSIKAQYYVGIGGETEFTIPALVAQNVFAAFKDGISFVVITSGTPVNKEVLYNNATGEFTWSLQFEEGEIAQILYY